MRVTGPGKALEDLRSCCVARSLVRLI